MDIYKECFGELTKEEERCAGMCESMIAYFNDLGGYADKQYLTKYRVSLGSNRVEEIYHKLKDYIDHNYQILTNVHTDSEGCTYNSIVKLG